MKLSLFIFVDAFGWEIFKRHEWFLKEHVRDQRPLKTVFGYSSACDPSMISGVDPAVHGHWSSYYYDPHHSPFKGFQWLKWLPLTSYSRVRNKLSKWMAAYLGWTGYFQLYNTPFEVLPYFNYAEKNWFWGVQNGLLYSSSIFDQWIQKGVRFYVKPSVHVSDEEQWSYVQEKIKQQEIDAAWLFLGSLDALMHAEGNCSPRISLLLKDYEKKILSLLELAKTHYSEVEWVVFSDHGMHNVTSTVDLQKEIQSLPIEWGVDYIAFYDSTMARFWHLTEKGKNELTQYLQHHPQGALVSSQNLKEWGTFFTDHRYGDLIFLLRPGILLIPSFMGRKPIPGMHGYHPNDPDSWAMIVSSHSLDPQIQSIKDIFNLLNNVCAQSRSHS